MQPAFAGSSGLTTSTFNTFCSATGVPPQESKDTVNISNDNGDAPQFSIVPPLMETIASSFSPYTALPEPPSSTVQFLMVPPVMVKLPASRMFTAPPQLPAEQFSIVPPFITKEAFPLIKITPASSSALQPLMVPLFIIKVHPLPISTAPPSSPALQFVIVPPFITNFP